ASIVARRNGDHRQIAQRDRVAWLLFQDLLVKLMGARQVALLMRLNRFLELLLGRHEVVRSRFPWSALARAHDFSFDADLGKRPGPADLTRPFFAGEAATLYIMAGFSHDSECSALSYCHHPRKRMIQCTPNYRCARWCV